MHHISRRGLLAGAAALALARPGDRAGRADQGRPDAAVLRHLRRTRREHRRRLRALPGGAGGKLGGRAVTLVRLDDEFDPAKAPQNVNRLLERDQVDVLIGTVHSGVVMALVQAAREREVPLIIPNAGNVAATRELCAPSVFRIFVQQLAAGLRHGQGAGGEGREEGVLGHLGLRRRQGIRRGLPRRPARRRRPS